MQSKKEPLSSPFTNPFLFLKKNFVSLCGTFWNLKDHGSFYILVSKASKLLLWKAFLEYDQWNSFDNLYMDYQNAGSAVFGLDKRISMNEWEHL